MLWTTSIKKNLWIFQCDGLHLLNICGYFISTYLILRISSGFYMTVKIFSNVIIPTYLQSVPIHPSFVPLHWRDPSLIRFFSPTPQNGNEWNFHRIFITYSHCELSILDINQMNLGVSHSKTWTMNKGSWWGPISYLLLLPHHWMEFNATCTESLLHVPIVNLLF